MGLACPPEPLAGFLRPLASRLRWCLPSLSPARTSAADSSCSPPEAGLLGLGAASTLAQGPLGDPLPVQLPGPPSLVKLGVRGRVRALRWGKKSLPRSCSVEP